MHISRWATAAALCLVAAAPPSRTHAQCGNIHSPYGINAHAPVGSHLTQVFDKVHAAGIGWVRIDFNWFAIEFNQDAFNWGPYDAIAAAAEVRGLRVFATLAYTPQWATAGAQQTGVPANPADWYDFCFRAAQRYPSIQHWGMWNEANLDQFWEGTRQQYIDIILRNGADAIHAANPAAKVCAPEMAHLTSGDQDWYYWLRDSINQAAGKIDIVTHHLYDSDGHSDVTTKLAGTTTFGTNPDLWTLVAPSVREVLVNTGWLGSPFWLTETGWGSDDVGEADQAAYYTGLLADWFTGLPNRNWLHRIFFYEIQDDPTPGITKWGILRSDLSEKPSYLSYQSFITAHPPAPVPPCPAHSPSPAHEATGVSISADLTWSPGAFAVSHQVCFGTANPPALVGTQGGSTYEPGPLDPLTTYYWRIDQVNAVGTTPGSVWSFITTAGSPPAQAANPSPPHLASNVSRTPQLTWTPGSGATAHRIYLGFTSPGTLQGTQSGTAFNPAALAGRMTYYWRIDEINAAGTTTGNVWSFTTGGIRSDFDNDQDVDQTDYSVHQLCISGNGLLYPAGCEPADFDADGDVDSADLGEFLDCMRGPDLPPGC